jgi:hypothetical protein
MRSETWSRDRVISLSAEWIAGPQTRPFLKPDYQITWSDYYSEFLPTPTQPGPQGPGCTNASRTKTLRVLSNRGKRSVRPSLLSIERLQPPTNALAKRRYRNITIAVRIGLQASQRRPQQGYCARVVSPLPMMKSRCNLNQRLQKSFIRPFSRQPDALPVLVSEEELLVPVALQSFRKRSAAPIK